MPQQVSAQEVTQDTETHSSEPSPEVEAVADEPAFATAAAPPPPAIEASAPAPGVAQPAKAPSWLDQPAPDTRRHPLRFMWQMDADGRFTLGSDEFTRLIGSRTAAGFGRLWSDIAAAFGLDPEGRVLKAAATRDTWAGIILNWPVDGGGRLPVELSGLPVFDRAHNFTGYRGFGVCRDLDGLARLAALRRYELFSDPPAPHALSAGIAAADAAADPAQELAQELAEELAQAKPAAEATPEDLAVAELPARSFAVEDLLAEDVLAEHLSADDLTEDLFVEDLPAEVLSAKSSVASSSIADPSAPIAFETSQQTDLETPVEPPNDTPQDRVEDTPKNVLPFRPISEAKSPVLTPVENSAFNELARQLSARLDSENGAPVAPASSETEAAVADKPAAPAAPKSASRHNGWRNPRCRRAARQGATRRCSIWFRSAC